LEDDYSHYRFEYEKNRNHLHIEGILEKQERSQGSRAPKSDEVGAQTPTLEGTNLYTKRWKTGLLSRVKDVENTVGLVSTELKAYKVRGGMKGRRELESQLGDG